MTCPREILPGSTYLVTRRCSERRFFLRPDGQVRAVFGYVLAVAARRFEVEIHCVTVMGNHYHAVVTDWNGRLPSFLAWLHRLVAVALNAYRGRWEAMWSSARPSVVRLETAPDVLDKMIYVLSNAVAAGLVERASEWPGLTAAFSSTGDPSSSDFRRPDKYFDPNGRLPTVARLSATKPPGFDDLSNEAFAELLRSRLAEREEQFAARRKERDESPLGAKRAASVAWASAPSTQAPRRGRVPHVAARDPDVRVRALERLRTFRTEYREALRRFRSGAGGVTFPAGTYAVRCTFGVRCHAPPPEIVWSRKS